MSVLAILLFCILAAIAAIHFYWAVKGGDIISPKVVPFIDGKPVFIPSRSCTFLVAAALSCMAVFVLSLSFYRFSFLSEWFWMAGGVILGIIFIGRAIGDFRLIGFFKKIKDSEFAAYDTYYWSPLCLVLGLGVLWLVFSGGPS